VLTCLERAKSLAWMGGTTRVWVVACFAFASCSEDAPATPPDVSRAEAREGSPVSMETATTETRTTETAPTAPATTETEASTADATPEAERGVVEPLVQAEIALDEDGSPTLSAALRGATRIGGGPWVETLDDALGAGWIDWARSDGLEVVVTLEHRGRLFVLVAAPSSVRVRPRTERPVSLWLAEVERRVDPEGANEAAGEAPSEGTPRTATPNAAAPNAATPNAATPSAATPNAATPSAATPNAALQHRRVAIVRLHEAVWPSVPLGGREGFECAVTSELRARDVDGDGETEVTAIAAFVPVTGEAECGALAHLVGVSDWNVQIALSREYAVERFSAGVEEYERRDARWRLEDADSDGHADLRVIESWRHYYDAMGDDVGGGEIVEASHGEGQDRRETLCPYDATLDAWRCPVDVGRIWFLEAAERDRSVGSKPW
jgi:hypothetical protein